MQAEHTIQISILFVVATFPVRDTRLLPLSYAVVEWNAALGIPPGFGVTTYSVGSCSAKAAITIPAAMPYIDSRHALLYSGNY